MRFFLFLLLFLSLSAAANTASSSPWTLYKPVVKNNADATTSQPSPFAEQAAAANTASQSVSYAASTPSGLEDRQNVMECSPDEVQAYFEQPDRAREVLNQYESFEKSYQQVEMKRAESDPAACLGMLYGDLSAMAEQMQGAVSGILSGGMPDFSALAQAAMEKLSESICSRVKEGTSALSNRIISEANAAQKKARSDVMRRYGQRAMERYVNDAILPPAFGDAGLIYKNGTIDDGAFKRKADRRWKSELDELEDSAVDSIKD